MKTHKHVLYVSITSILQDLEKIVKDIRIMGFVNDAFGKINCNTVTKRGEDEIKSSSLYVMCLSVF